MNVRRMIAVLTLAFALFITVGVNAQDKKAPAAKKPAASGGDTKPAPKKSSGKKGHKKSHKKSGKKSTKKASSGGDTKAPAKTPAKKKS